MFVFLALFVNNYIKIAHQLVEFAYLRIPSDIVGTRNPSMIMELQRLMQRMMLLVKLWRIFFDFSTRIVVEKANREQMRPADAPHRVDLDQIKLV